MFFTFSLQFQTQCSCIVIRFSYFIDLVLKRSITISFPSRIALRFAFVHSRTKEAFFGLLHLIPKIINRVNGLGLWWANQVWKWCLVLLNPSGLSLVHGGNVMLEYVHAIWEQVQWWKNLISLFFSKVFSSLPIMILIHNLSKYRPDKLQQPQITTLPSVTCTENTSYEICTISRIAVPTLIHTSLQKMIIWTHNLLR